jgi:methyl-accepting chemotaxis protein
MLGLRDLPIAAKLTLSAGLALLLLGVLVVSVRSSSGRVEELYRQGAEDEQAARNATLARRAAFEMQLLSQEVIHNQSVEGAKTAVTGVAAQAALAREALRKAAVSTDAAMHEKLTVVEARLATFETVLSRTLELRVAMLETRDKDFFPQYRGFAKQLESVRAGLAAEDIPYAELAPLRSALEDYASAVNTARVTTLRFLATGDRSEAAALKDAAANASANVETLQHSAISAELKSQVAALAAAGTGMQHAAAELFEVAARLDAFAARDLDAALRAMHQSVDEAVQDFVTRAEASRGEAADAMASSRAQTLWYAAGIAVLMLGAGIGTAKAIARPIRLMTLKVQAMARGDTSLAIGHAGRRDEIGRMAAALESLRDAVRKAFVQSQMIEQIPVGIMTADAREGRITYANPESLHVMERIRSHLPVPPDQLVGQPLAVVDPQQPELEQILRDPARLPHRSRIKIGGEAMDLLISPLRDAEGQYAGPMVTWSVQTGRVRLSERFEQTVGAIATSVGKNAQSMTETAQAMSQAAAESGQGSMAVATASDEAAANVQSVAASAEELAASVQEISRQVSESARIAGQAVREAEDTDRCVNNLSEAANRIGDVVRLISDIAGRTNLLALNATIEAARAGEAGKGFAVVASEVKTLATQTAKATGEIGAQIGAMQGEVAQAVGALRSIGDTIQRMNEIATAIAGAVEEQGATTQEIARAVQHAAIGTSEVSGNISTVRNSVDHTGRQAEAVLEAAKALTAQSDTLKAEVASFLTAVQEAA